MTIWLTLGQVTARESWSGCTPLYIRAIDNPADWQALHCKQRMEYLEEQTVQSTDISKSPKHLLLFLGGARKIASSRSCPNDADKEIVHMNRRHDMPRGVCTRSRVQCIHLCVCERAMHLHVHWHVLSVYAFGVDLSEQLFNSSHLRDFLTFACAYSERLCCGLAGAVTRATR